MPIYYVITVYIPTIMHSQYRILASWATTVEEVQTGKFDREVAEWRLQCPQGMNIFIFQREPENPFRDLGNVKHN